MNGLIKLLVIDDDAADRLQLKRALKNCGFTYELSEYEAFDITIDFSAFDCIFLDYLLPGENGLSLLKKIRDTGIKTPIVIFTSQGNENIAVELMKAGASDYIVKNAITSQSMAQVLRNMLQIGEMIRKKDEAEKALCISEARLAEAQHIAKFGNWEFDTIHNRVHFSEEVYNILELEKHEVVPSLDLYRNHIYEEDKAFVKANVAQALRGARVNYDHRIQTRAGIKYINIQIYPSQGQDGTLQKFIGIIQDITTRKRAEEEILKARELTENLMKVKEIFLANMSHEIRTPMNAILGFTRLLFETNLSQEQKSFVDAIHFSGENLLVIINDILDLSKIQSGKMTIEKYEFNVHELVKGIIKVMQPRAQEKGLTLIDKIDAQIIPIVKGDPVRLNQILTNLISNAIKFTEKGGVTVELSSLASEGIYELFEFRIQDSGIGIPEDKQSVIFDDFVQASDDTTRKYGGTGLGLSIVKKLVTLQKGKIALQSTPGIGSTFTVHLTFEKVNIKESVSSAAIPSLSDFAEKLRGTTVLVAEDNTLNQALVKKILEKAGCQMDIASNGLEAIHYLQNKVYDVVLMDVQMPEMDGYETTQYIRNEMAAPQCNIPIIAMTAHAFGDDVSRCISAGMNDYISKPFKAETLYLKLLKYTESPDKSEAGLLSEQVMASYTMDFSVDKFIADSQNLPVDFFEILERETPVYIAALQHAVENRDLQSVKSICTQIKSSFSLLKIIQLDHLVDDLIFLMENGQTNAFEIIHKPLDVLISLLAAVNHALKNNLKRSR
ncbi:response regulator [Ohtaekwangia kribbensis]|uniref:histidine kinase n=1 Tax=Ohtaekwangia kribbensis TaxID=688913 RepID=A0ABW3K5Q4_9BACT